MAKARGRGYYDAVNNELSRLIGMCVTRGLIPNQTNIFNASQETGTGISKKQLERWVHGERGALDWCKYESTHTGRGKGGHEVLEKPDMDAADMTDAELAEEIRRAAMICHVLGVDVFVMEEKTRLVLDRAVGGVTDERYKKLYRMIQNGEKA